MNADVHKVVNRLRELNKRGNMIKIVYISPNNQTCSSGIFNSRPYLLLIDRELFKEQKIPVIDLIITDVNNILHIETISMTSVLDIIELPIQRSFYANLLL